MAPPPGTQNGPTDLLVEAIANRVAEIVLPRMIEELVKRENLRGETERPQRLLSPTEAAVLARRSKTTVYDAIRAGQLKHRLDEKGRYRMRPEDVEAWAASLGKG